MHDTLYLFELIVVTDGLWRREVRIHLSNTTYDDVIATQGEVEVTLNNGVTRFESVRSVDDVCFGLPCDIRSHS